MDPIRRVTISLDSAPATSATKAATQFPTFLALHLGCIVVAAAGALGEGIGELENGGLTGATRGRGGHFICELFKWRQFLIDDHPNFDSLAHQQGMEMYVAAGSSLEGAKVLIDGVFKILGRIVRDQAN